MKETRNIMGMPITLEIAGTAEMQDIDDIFAYFVDVDQRFSTYKDDSEIMRINRFELPEARYSKPMREVFALADATKRTSDGYFDIRQPSGFLDPSGIVKGWAIQNAAAMLHERGYENFYINAGGDSQSYGKNPEGDTWSVGIRNPWNRDEIVKVLYPMGAGVATSGTSERGQHIYDPFAPTTPLTDVVSITVVGPNILEADRFATAAFAMGSRGIHFIESLPGFEGYQIDSTGNATMTTGFEHYTQR